MKIVVLICGLACFSSVKAESFVYNPDTAVTVVEKAKIQAWMADARHKMFEGDWRGALTGYREVLALDKGNAKAEYRVAECQYELMVYEFALEHLENAIKNNNGEAITKEDDYLKGNILHRLGRLEEAIEAFENFKKLNADRKNLEEEFFVDKNIADCKYAIEALKSPLDVEVKVLSENVNGRFRDYGPVLSPDGKELYFTSRRNDTYGGNVAGDKVFFSDIYMSRWDDAKGEWGPAISCEGKVNSEEFDAISDIYIDDKDNEIMLITNNIAGATKSSDIAYAKRSEKGGAWGKPRLEKKYKRKKGGINSSYFESSATVTDDGNTMYFLSEGMGSLGQSDIFEVKKEKGKWGVPVNLGASINTPYNENSVWVTGDGNYLFFSSDGREGMGGKDIYMCKKEGDSWSAPKNLGAPINSVNDDIHFKISPDGKKAYITSARKDRYGLHDIYEIDLKGLNLFE